MKDWGICFVKRALRTLLRIAPDTRTGVSLGITIMEDPLGRPGGGVYGKRNAIEWEK